MTLAIFLRKSVLQIHRQTRPFKKWIKLYSCLQELWNRLRSPTFVSTSHTGGSKYHSNLKWNKWSSLTVALHNVAHVISNGSGPKLDQQQRNLPIPKHEQLDQFCGPKAFELTKSHPSYSIDSLDTLKSRKPRGIRRPSRGPRVSSSDQLVQSARNKEMKTARCGFIDLGLTIFIEWASNQLIILLSRWNMEFKYPQQETETKNASILTAIYIYSRMFMGNSWSCRCFKLKMQVDDRKLKFTQVQTNIYSFVTCWNAYALISPRWSQSRETFAAKTNNAVQKNPSCRAGSMQLTFGLQADPKKRSPKNMGQKLGASWMLQRCWVIPTCSSWSQLSWCIIPVWIGTFMAQNLCTKVITNWVIQQ